MSRGTQSRLLILVIVVLVGVATYWLGSGRLMRWLLALHGQRGSH